MNRILILSLLLFTLFSCSSDDDTENSNDPILGKWFLFSVNNTEVSDCEKKSSIEFKSNGLTISDTHQVAGTNGTDCLNISIIENRWENKGDNLYSFNNLESVISFSSDGTSFTITSGNLVYKKN